MNKGKKEGKAPSSPTVRTTRPEYTAMFAGPVVVITASSADINERRRAIRKALIEERQGR